MMNYGLSTSNQFRVQLCDCMRYTVNIINQLNITIMKKNEIKNLVKGIADKYFTRCDDELVRLRCAEASLHLMLACKGDANMIEAIFGMIDDFYTCYYYGEGMESTSNSEFVQSWKSTEHGEFLVRYSRKIAFALCAEDESVAEDYINEIVAYKNEHVA